MNSDNHIPAYKRQNPIYGYKNMTKYRPSIFRDIWGLIKDIVSKYKAPYNFERVLEIFFITLFFPMVLPLGVYYTVHCACKEKLEWNCEHSKWVMEKKEKKESFTYPGYSILPVIVGLTWSLPTFAVSLVVYSGFFSMYEYFISKL